VRELFQRFSFLPTNNTMNIPRYILPLLIAAALFGGYALRAAFTHPSSSVQFSANGSKKVTCIVDGIRCKGTSDFFIRLYSKTPGIAHIETYATEHKAIIKYDPNLITPNQIRSVMEAQIPLRDGTSRQVFFCQSMK